MTMEAQTPSTPGLARGWEDLDLEIAFDVGEGLFPLGEVRAWKPGVVLPLPGNPDGKVRIRVNGKAAGFGALLMIDGRAGVRILSLGLETDPESPADSAATAAEAT